MADYPKIIYQSGTDEIVEKKSRFIAFPFLISSEEEAQEIIAAHKKEYWDARHNCYAYVLGDDSRHQRYSDDGEPAGTAGRPILDVLLGRGITNALIIVTRYFGGTLLGTGGLVRAYQKSASAGLDACILLEKQTGTAYTVTCDYTTAGKLSYLFANEEVPVTDTRYGEAVETDLILSDEKKDRLIKLLNDTTAGKAGIEEKEKVYFGILNGRAILL